MDWVDKVVTLVIGFLCAILAFVFINLLADFSEISKNYREQQLVEFQEMLVYPAESPPIYDNYQEGFCKYHAGDWLIGGEILTIDPETCFGRTSEFSIRIDPNPNQPWYSSFAVFCGESFGCVSHPVRVENDMMFDIFYNYFSAERIE